jgi:putative ABC transport system permease protein
MIKSFFKTAYRSLLKNKFFSFLNILGLAIGMAMCFFIFQYVHFEQNFERYNNNAENVYRIPLEFYGNPGTDHIEATNHPAVGPALKANFPEVISFVRLIPTKLILPRATISRIEDGIVNVSFNQKRVFFADPGIFKMFSVPFIYGNEATALTQIRAIAISESQAKKYFGNENPMGKTLFLNGGFDVNVTGVFKDIPENSHLKFDMVISFPDEKYHADNWAWPEFYTYVMLAPGSNPKNLEDKLPAFIDRYLGSEMKLHNFKNRFHLQPIKDIHLGSHCQKELEVNGSKRDILFLSIISVFVLLIACINYINLSTAKSMERASEVGMRKVVGASKSQLVCQFLSESIIVNCLALFLAAVIVLCLAPYYGDFVGRAIAKGFWTSGLLGEPGFWIVLLLLLIGGAFLIGIYPALLMSKFNPVYVLKGKFYGSQSGIMVRKVLVTFQFILAVIWIAGSLIVFHQLNYMRNQSLGYNKDQILVVNAPGIYDPKAHLKIGLLQSELLKNTVINEVGLSSDIPGEAIVWRYGARMFGKASTQNAEVSITQIDDRFFKAYQMQLVAGQNFELEDGVDVFPIDGVTFPDKVSIIVNESFAKNLGFMTSEDAVSKLITFDLGTHEFRGEIKGIIKDYHQRSLKDPYEPMLYYFPSRPEWKYLSLNINTKNVERNISSIQNTYKNVLAGTPFEFFFVDDFFNEQYKSDQQFGKVFNAFTALTIFVSCLGLLGLLSFIVRIRVKEIGIRRVLGASAYSIIILFFKDFFKLIVLATLIALPVIYFAGNRWLNNFAFHAPLNVLVFILPPLILVVITFAAVTAQSLTAALSNPVNAIKIE